MNKEESENTYVGDWIAKGRYNIVEFRLTTICKELQEALNRSNSVRPRTNGLMMIHAVEQ